MQPGDEVGPAVHRSIAIVHIELSFSDYLVAAERSFHGLSDEPWDPGTLEPRPSDDPPGLEGSNLILQVPTHCVLFILCTRRPEFLPALWRVELTWGRKAPMPFLTVYSRDELVVFGCRDETA